MVFGVFGFLLGLLTFGGWQHRMHPLAVFAEFYIDILRGIPMLVIILYVGLPLSGAVKQATDGFIDLPNMIRGCLQSVWATRPTWQRFSGLASRLFPKDR